MKVRVFDDGGTKRAAGESGNMAHRLVTIYNAMNDHFGDLSWWPGETAFDVAVGAILTQNTNWKNVERAIANLRKENLLHPDALYKTDPGRVAELIRPAGFFNVKTRRLRAFLEFLQCNYEGNMEAMSGEETGALRKRLLSVNGVGEETADSILLYGFQKPVFVVDAYTRRIFTHHGFIDERWTYHDVQRLFMDNLPQDSALYNQYHALIVETAKRFCRTQPLCMGCPLKQ